MAHRSMKKHISEESIAGLSNRGTASIFNIKNEKHFDNTGKER